MTPTTGALALQAGSAVAGGMAGRSQAQGEMLHARINSYIGRTRAIQTDTAARQALADQTSTQRTALAASGQRMNVGVLDMLNEYRTVAERERRIDVGNRMQESRDFSREGRNAKSRGQWAMTLGLAKAGPSMFDLAEVLRNG